MLCPFDTGAADTNYYRSNVQTHYGRRSYAMNAIDGGTFTDIGSPLPTPFFGLGIDWGKFDTMYTSPSLPAYKVSIVQRPAETINLVEHPSADNLYGATGACACWGPAGNFAGDEADAFLGYQTESANPLNYGLATYKLQGNRFNYLFFDDHVSKLAMQQTVGNGTTNQPRGMWMLNPNNPYY